MFTKGLAKSKNQHSLEYLKYLYSVLCRNQTINEKNRTLLIEVIRLISEIVIWGDQNDSSVTDFFLEKNILSMFLKYLKQKHSRLICVQLLQTLNILFENIKDKTSMYYLLSNNHINSVICHKFDFSDEEVMAYYILFLKVLSLKLDQDTINFFYNQYTDDFALYTEAIKFFNHPESMVRIAVRTITLNVYRVQDQAMLRYIREKTADPYFDNLVWFIGNHVLDIDSCIKNGEHRSRLVDLVHENYDNLLYINDILCLGLPSINDVLCRHLMEHLILPLYVFSLSTGASPRHPSDSSSPGKRIVPQRVRLSRAVAIFLLAEVFLVIHDNDLVQALAQFIFCEDLSALEYSASYSSSKLAQTTEDGDEIEMEAVVKQRPTRAFRAPEHPLAETLDRIRGVPRPGECVDDKDSSVSDTDSFHFDEDLEATEEAEEMDTALDNSFQASGTTPSAHSAMLPSEPNEAIQKDPTGVSTSDRVVGARGETPMKEESSATVAPAAAPRVNTLRQESFSLEGRGFLDIIFQCLETSADDYEAQVAVCLIFSIVTNKGITSDTLGLAQLSAANECTGKYNSRLVKKLLSIIGSACKQGSKIQLTTLDMTALLLRVLVDTPDKSHLQDSHVAYIEGAKEESTMVLRNYFTNDDTFLEIFEEETALFKRSSMTRGEEGRLVLDSSVLLPPSAADPSSSSNTNSPAIGRPRSQTLMLTGSGAGLLPSQEVQNNCRRAVRVWLQLTRLSDRLGLGREAAEDDDDSAAATGPSVQTSNKQMGEDHVILGDRLDLNNRDLITCTVDYKNGTKKERRFLVMDPQQFILVEPDVKKLGWGVVNFVGLLQYATVANATDDSKCLHVTVSRPPSASSSSQGTPIHSPARVGSLLKADFLFDDYIRCMAAKRLLTKGRAKVCQMKLQRIARLLEIPTQATDLGQNLNTDSAASSRRSVPFQQPTTTNDSPKLPSTVRLQRSTLHPESRLITPKKAQKEPSLLKQNVNSNSDINEKSHSLAAVVSQPMSLVSNVERINNTESSLVDKVFHDKISQQMSPESSVIDNISQPMNAESSVVDNVSQPMKGESSAVDNVSKPMNAESSVVDNVSQPMKGESSAVDNVSQPMNAESSVVDNVSQPMKGESSAVDNVSQPMKGEFSAVDNISQPMKSESSAVDNISQPMNAESSAVDNTSQPMKSEYSAVDNVSQPMNAESSAVDNTSQSSVDKVSLLIEAQTICRPMNITFLADEAVSESITDESSPANDINSISPLVNNISGQMSVALIPQHSQSSGYQTGSSAPESVPDHPPEWDAHPPNNSTVIDPQDCDADMPLPSSSHTVSIIK